MSINMTQRRYFLLGKAGLHIKTYNSKEYQLIMKAAREPAENQQLCEEKSPQPLLLACGLESRYYMSLCEQRLTHTAVRVWAALREM